MEKLSLLWHFILKSLYVDFFVLLIIRLEDGIQKSGTDDGGSG